jgi:hypothetical protein
MKSDDVKSQFKTDENNNPTGGSTTGIGMSIEWQDGIKNNGQNGAFVEDVITAAIQRLEFFNDSKFRCRENSLAITKLEEALLWLNYRTANRQNQGVENTYNIHQ